MSLTTSLQKNKSCAVIPFYNEGETVIDLVKEVENYVDFVIPVDDGSDDISSDRLSLLPPNSYYIRFEKNQGKGAAIRKGLEKAIELGFEYIITIDADFQHDPKLIPKFIEKLSYYDIVVGNRLKSISSMPLQRKASNFITSKLLSIKTKNNILDSQSGFRGFNSRILEDILPNYKGFEAESEMLVMASRHECSIGFIQIPTIYGKTNSKMKAIPAILGFIKVLLRK